MIDKKEIAARIVIFSAVYTVVVVLILLHFGYEWLFIPALVVIVVWGVYVYRMNVKVLTMPVQSMDVNGFKGTALTDISENSRNIS